MFVLVHSLLVHAIKTEKYKEHGAARLLYGVLTRS